jgi:transcriptional regulator with XRE-family HTH domain
MPDVVKKTRTRRKKNITGGRIAAIRKKKGITQLELSDRVCRIGANLDRAAIAKIENGLRCVLDYELAALSAALHSHLLP